MIQEKQAQNLESLARPALRMAVFSFVANAFLALTKILGGILGNSYALIADGIESTLDVFSSLIAAAGLRVAMRPPDSNHPYGHGKAESLAALVAAFGLIAAGVGIGIQSIREILSPSGIPAPFTLVILVGVIVIKWILMRTTKRVSHDCGSSSLRAESAHHAADALTSLIAFIGISVSLLAGPGYESAEDWAALLACVLIVYNGTRMLRLSIDDIMDAVYDSPDSERVRELAAEVEGVRRIEKCRLRRSGLQYVVEIHIEVEASLSVLQGHEIAHQVKNHVLEQQRSVADLLVHVEPYSADES